MHMTHRLALTLAATAVAVGGAAVPAQAATNTPTDVHPAATSTVTDGSVVNGPLVAGPLVDLSILDGSSIGNNLVAPFIGNYMDNRGS